MICRLIAVRNPDGYDSMEAPIEIAWRRRRYEIEGDHQVPVPGIP
jgi:hypothetical protein